jgi:hypothetical protein
MIARTAVNSVHAMGYIQGAAKKKQSPRQTLIFQQWHYVFQRNFQSLLKRYFAIFPVNFIAIFGLDQKL